MQLCLRGANAHAEKGGPELRKVHDEVAAQQGTLEENAAAVTVRKKERWSANRADPHGAAKHTSQWKAFPSLCTG